MWKLCCFLESWVDVHFTSVPSPVMVRALYEATQVILGEFFLLESSLHLTLHICNPHFSLCNNKYICSFFHDSFSGTSRLLFRFLSCTRLHFCCSFSHSPCVLLKHLRTYIAKENILGLWDSLWYKRTLAPQYISGIDFANSTGTKCFLSFWRQKSEMIENIGLWS